MKRIIILMNLALLGGCLSAGFDKGAHPDESLSFKRHSVNQNVALEINDSLGLEFSSHQCGYYGLAGVIIPIIPNWKNYDCNDFNVSIRKASHVYLKHGDKIYSHSRFNPKSYFNYTFPIPVKSLADGATLIIEKDGENFEIPFRYQHKFRFILWGT